MAGINIDPEKYDFIKQRCKDVRGKFGTRNTLMTTMEDYFLMKWNENKPQDPNIIQMVDPDSHNALKGAARLLKATDPKVRVPEEKNDEEAKKASSNIERAGSAIIYANSRSRDIPVQNETTMSALLFGEIHAGITLTEDLVRYAEKGSSKSYQNRVKELASRTPIIIDIYDPRTCYPIIDSIGVAGYHRYIRKTAFELVDMWGDQAREILGQTDKYKIDYEKPYYLCDYIDWEYRIIWIDDKPETPLVFAPHELGELPVVYRVAGGSRLHQNTGDQVQPFLYAMYKSGLQNAKNMAMTMLFDHIYTLGATGQYAYRPNVPGKPLAIRWETKGGYYELGANESLETIMKPTLDQTVMAGLELAERKATESTIYRQALGEPLGSNAPYSMISLLNHAGRQALLDAQRAASWAFGDIIEKAFRMLKSQTKGKSTIAGRSGYIELKTSEIPKDFMVEVDFEIDLPQDIKQNAAIAAQLISSDLADKEYVRSKLLQIDQSDEMDKKIMKQKLIDLFTTMQIEQTMAAIQQQKQPPPTIPGGATPPTQQPGQPGAGMQPPPQGQGAGLQLPPGLANMDPEQIMAVMQQSNIPPDVQQQVMAQLMAQREGVTEGMPMTQPMEIPGSTPETRATQGKIRGI